MEVTQCKGEGHGSCRRCTNKTGWNMSWMEYELDVFSI